MPDKTEEILKLAIGEVENIALKPIDEITGASRRFGLIVENCIGLSLVSAGALFAVLGIILGWKSWDIRFVTLIICGVFLLLAGAATSLIICKWRLDAEVVVQSQRLEALRLQLGLRETGINGVVEKSKIFVCQTVIPCLSRAEEGTQKK